MSAWGQTDMCRGVGDQGDFWSLELHETSPPRATRGCGCRLTLSPLIVVLRLEVADLFCERVVCPWEVAIYVHGCLSRQDCCTDVGLYPTYDLQLEDLSGEMLVMVRPAYGTPSVGVTATLNVSAIGQHT